MFYFPYFSEAPLPHNIPTFKMVFVDFYFDFFFKLRIVGFGVKILLQGGPDSDNS